MKFKILDDDYDVLGGEVGENNACFVMFMERFGGCDYRTLDVGESMMAQFSCSGTGGNYRVLRTV